MPSAETQAIFFHLTQQHDPYHEGLTTSVIQHVGTDIHTSAFAGQRARTNDLLIHRTEGTDLGFVMESNAAYMGRFQSDLSWIIFRSTTSKLPLKSLHVIEPYMELRDDQSFTDSNPLATWYTNQIISADVNNTITGLSVWDQHSTLALECIRRAFHEHNRDVHITSLTATRLLAREFGSQMKKKNIKKYAVAALDLGDLHRAMIGAREIGAPIILFDKSRPKIESVEFSKPYIADAENGTAVPANEHDLEGLTVLSLDDLSGTGKTNRDTAALLREYGVSQVHAAISHETLIQPEARKRLGEAMAKKEITSLMFTDTVPHTMNGSTRIISVAPATAAHMRYVAGKENPEDLKLLEDVILPPSPPKYELKELLMTGRLPLTIESWPPIGTTIPQEAVLYRYTSKK